MLPRLVSHRSTDKEREANNGAMNAGGGNLRRAEEDLLSASTQGGDLLPTPDLPPGGLTLTLT